ncbi:ABC transporter permease [Aliiglaciecola sp. 3_MG-2023]|uniref:ABC transporter permease n=1 Tax=Aliiglaciecola sp. 3_MG-2023 TaxID=3062644 RepID=UPI0026E22BDD|nr:ABC transporter permease [Aliiglaciecola sp. 3_MG-2023]MDO6691946.1 ABC transporter permease [Aliiglaciecola sp. 3_MG-2023]
MTTVIKRNKWEIWRDVIFALFAREIRTGFNDKFGLSWAVVNPIAFIFVLSFIRGRIAGGDTHGVPTFVFMAYGLVFIQMFLQTFNNCSGAIKKNKALFAFRQVQPISAVIATAMFEVLVKIFVILGIFIVMYFLKMEIKIANPLLMIFCIFVLWWFAVVLGLAVGILILYVPEVNKLVGLATRPLFFISGTFFSLQDIPKEYWSYLDWNPILHAIELARYAAYTEYGTEGVSFSYVAGTVLVTTFLSLSVYYSRWRQAISR